MPSYQGEEIPGALLPDVTDDKQAASTKKRKASSSLSEDHAPDQLHAHVRAKTKIRMARHGGHMRAELTVGEERNENPATELTATPKPVTESKAKRAKKAQISAGAEDCTVSTAAGDRDDTDDGTQTAAVHTPQPPGAQQTAGNKSRKKKNTAYSDVAPDEAEARADTGGKPKSRQEVRSWVCWRRREHCD